MKLLCMSETVLARLVGVCRRRTSGWASGVLLTLVGLTLRVLTIDSRGLWLDEAITVSQATLPVSGVVHESACGVHPPLYHLVMHYWISVFGRSEVALRAFSTAVGVAAISAAWWAGTRIYDRRTGLIAAGLVALSPTQIWYSQEAKMYELLFLCGLLSTGFLALAVRENRVRLWLGYLTASLAGLFAHYFYSFLVMGQVGFYLFGVLVPAERRARREGRARASLSRPWRLLTDVRTLGPWLTCTAVMGVLLVAWIVAAFHLQHADLPSPLISSVRGSGPGYAQEPPSLAFRFNDTAAVLLQMIAGFHSARVQDAIVSMWPGLIFLSLLLWRVLGPVTQKTWLLLAASSGALVVVTLGQWQGGVLLARYFMALAAPLYLLAARLLATLEKRAAVPVLAALTVLALVAWADQSYDPRNSMRFDNRELLGVLASDWRPGDAVIYVPFYLEPLTDYYIPRGTRTEGFPQYGPGGTVRDSPRRIEQDVDRVVGPSRRVWLFLSFQNIGKLRSTGYVIRYWLGHNGYELESHRRMNQVELLLYETPHRRRFSLRHSRARGTDTCGRSRPSTSWAEGAP